MPPGESPGLSPEREVAFTMDLLSVVAPITRIKVSVDLSEMRLIRQM